MILVFLKKEVKKLMKEFNVENPDLLTTGMLMDRAKNKLQLKTAYVFVSWLNNSEKDLKKYYFRHSDNKEFKKIKIRGW